MKIGLLGYDRDTPELLAAAAVRGDRIAWAAEVEGHADELQARFPGLKLEPYWETILTGQEVDVLVVARAHPGVPVAGETLMGDDLREDQLRKLIQERVPVLVSHPACSSMLVYWELDMIRRDTACPAVPAIFSRWHPAVAALRTQLVAGELGLLEQAVFERTLADRRRVLVQSQFARDADLLRQLTGEITRVGAMGTGARVEGAAVNIEADFANLGLQLSGPSGVAIRWQVAPADETGPRGTLTLRGANGRVELHMPHNPAAPWTVRWFLPSGNSEQTYPGNNIHRQALDTMEAALAGQAISPHWVDGCRGVELADTIERSLHKGRVIELHFEDHTEQGTFKGTMTSLGCAIMLGALGLMLFAAVAGKLGFAIAQYWHFMLLGVLILFLALQSLRLVFASEPRKK